MAAPLPQTSAGETFGCASRAVRSGWRTVDRVLAAAAGGGGHRWGQHEGGSGPPSGPLGGSPNSPLGNLVAELEQRLEKRRGVAGPGSSPPASADGAATGERGLVRGGVHEWLGVGSSDANRAGDRSEGSPRRRGRRVEQNWSPPLLVLRHLAEQAARDAARRGVGVNLVWIGRRVWPYPRALTGGLEVAQTGATPALNAGGFACTLELRESPRAFAAEGGDLFERSLFVDPKDLGERLWAIDTSLRCPGVTAVIADGSGLGMAATRRLQLAAAAANALVLLARPPSEVTEISAATTRWLVERAPRRIKEGESHASDGEEPLRWTLKLLRAKGSQVLLRDELERLIQEESERAAARGAGRHGGAGRRDMFHGRTDPEGEEVFGPTLLGPTLLAPARPEPLRVNSITMAHARVPTRSPSKT